MTLVSMTWGHKGLICSLILASIEVHWSRVVLPIAGEGMNPLPEKTPFRSLI